MITIYANACVLTQDADKRVLIKGSVAVEGSAIVMVGRLRPSPPLSPAPGRSTARAGSSCPAW
jgi:hypothetical protein